jgi:predicted NUDIX family NTP pyrophosphohydrolase
VLLAHPGGPYWAKKDEGAWTVPKGEIDEGEEPVLCALRELEEELGPAAKVDREELFELGSVRQRGGKVVQAWAGEAEFDPAALESSAFSMEWPPRSGRQQEFPEVDRVGWFTPEEARRRILPAQVEFVDRLLARV